MGTYALTEDRHLLHNLLQLTEDKFILLFRARFRVQHLLVRRAVLATRATSYLLVDDTMHR